MDEEGSNSKIEKPSAPLKMAGSILYEMIRFRSRSALYVLNTRNLPQSNQLEDLYE